MTASDDGGWFSPLSICLSSHGPGQVAAIASYTIHEAKIRSHVVQKARQPDWVGLLFPSGNLTVCLVRGATKLLSIVLFPYSSLNRDRHGCWHPRAYRDGFRIPARLLCEVRPARLQEKEDTSLACRLFSGLIVLISYFSESI